MDAGWQAWREAENAPLPITHSKPEKSSFVKHASKSKSQTKNGAASKKSRTLSKRKRRAWLLVIWTVLILLLVNQVQKYGWPNKIEHPKLPKAISSANSGSDSPTSNVGSDLSVDLNASVVAGKPWYLAIVSFCYDYRYSVHNSGEIYDSAYNYLAPKKFWWESQAEIESTCPSANPNPNELYIFDSQSEHSPLVIANLTKARIVIPETIDTYPVDENRKVNLPEDISVSKNKNYYSSFFLVDYYRVDSMPEFNSALNIAYVSNLEDATVHWILNMDEVSNGFGLLDNSTTQVETEAKNIQIPNYWSPK